MKRAEKIKTLKGLLSGETTLGAVRRHPVFCCYKQSEEEPHLFYDEAGRPMTEREILLREQIVKDAYLIWSEVRMYANKSSLLNSYQ